MKKKTVDRHAPITLSGVHAKKFIEDLDSEKTAIVNKKNLELLRMAKKIVSKSR